MVFLEFPVHWNRFFHFHPSFFKSNIFLHFASLMTWKTLSWGPYSVGSVGVVSDTVRISPISQRTRTCRYCHGLLRHTSHACEADLTLVDISLKISSIDDNEWHHLRVRYQPSYKLHLLVCLHKASGFTLVLIWNDSQEVSVPYG